MVCVKKMKYSIIVTIPASVRLDALVFSLDVPSQRVILGESLSTNCFVFQHPETLLVAFFLVTKPGSFLVRFGGQGDGNKSTLLARGVAQNLCVVFIDSL